VHGDLYDDSEAMAHAPLTAEDLDTLLRSDGSFFTQDARRVRHLLTRVRAAFGTHRDQLRSLQRDVELMHADARRKASPLAGALDALRRLSAAEQRQVYDIRTGQVLDDLEQARADAERVKLAAQSEANRVRFVLAKVLADASVPAEVRRTVQDALRMLPAEVGMVTDAGLVWPQAPVPDGKFTVAAADSEEFLSDALFGEQGGPGSPSAVPAGAGRQEVAVPDSADDAGAGGPDLQDLFD